MRTSATPHGPVATEVTSQERFHAEQRTTGHRSHESQRHSDSQKRISACCTRSAGDARGWRGVYLSDRIVGVDIWPEKKRSEVMSRIRSSGTQPEVRLRAIVKQALPRHKIVANDPLLPGKPDIVVPSLRLAIFVDGCFWHLCPQHGRIPTSRADYWEPKLRGNQRRGQRQARQLRSMGYSVWRVWEHDLKSAKLEHTTQRLARRLQQRRAATTPW